MGAGDHREAASQRGEVRCAVLTISDTRTTANDASGHAIEERLRAAGFEVVQRALCPDEPELIRATVSAMCARDEVDAVITTGGTGLTPRDQTCEALAPLFERRIDGFGELFRMLSWQQVGAAAMLSRAVAGTVCGKAVFALPGAEAAVRLAVEQLIVPELRHLVWLIHPQTQAQGPLQTKPADTHHHHHHHHHHHGGHGHGGHGEGGSGPLH
jgi:molybdenum cofactor biosynthesis protein B